MNPFRDGAKGPAPIPQQLVRVVALRKAAGVYSDAEGGFGIRVAPVDEDSGDEHAPLVVQHVVPGSGAAAAGVRVGDVLLELGGISVRGRGAGGLREAMATLQAREAASGQGCALIDVALVFQQRVVPSPFQTPVLSSTFAPAGTPPATPVRELDPEAQATARALFNTPTQRSCPAELGMEPKSEPEPEMVSHYRDGPWHMAQFDRLVSAQRCVDQVLLPSV